MKRRYRMWAAHRRLEINLISLDHHYKVGYDLFAGGKYLMIAYGRGSKRLAGAASLKYGVPAIVGAFGFHCGYSSLVRATA